MKHEKKILMSRDLLAGELASRLIDTGAVEIEYSGYGFLYMDSGEIKKYLSFSSEQTALKWFHFLTHGVLITPVYDYKTKARVHKRQLELFNQQLLEALEEQLLKNPVKKYFSYLENQNPRVLSEFLSQELSDSRYSLIEMADHYASVKLNYKIYSGFFYEVNKAEHFYSNGLFSITLKKYLEQLLIHGGEVSPLYHSVYERNFGTAQEVSQNFSKKARESRDKLKETITTKPNGINSKSLNNTLSDLEEGHYLGLGIKLYQVFK